MPHISKVGILCLSIMVGTDFYFNKDRQIYFEFSFFDSRKFAFKHKMNYPEKKKNIKVVAPSKLKIAFVISSLYGGGAERVASRLANHWSRSGHQVCFFLTSVGCDKTYPLNKEILINNIAKKTKLRILPSTKINVLTNEIEAYSPDVIVSFLITPSFYASVAAKRLEIPFVSSERNDPSKTNILYKMLKKITYSRSNHVVFQGQYAMDYYPKYIKDKSSILINPVEVESVKNVNKEKYIISVGRLEKPKGFDNLIKAFTKVNAIHPEYSLKIYGQGKEHDELQSLITSQGLDGHVELLPFTESIHLEMKKSSVYVLSSRFEGMPNAMCEALLLGIPCVSTDCPIGLSSTLIENNKNGVICKTDNVDELALSVINVIDNYQSFSENAINKIKEYEKMFDPNLISESWIEIFKNAIEEVK